MKLLHIHLFKNAGTSIINLFKNQLDEKYILDYELKSDGSLLAEADRYVNSQLVNFISTTEYKNLFLKKKNKHPITTEEIGSSTGL